MAAPAFAQDDSQITQRCANMFLDKPVADAMGYTLKRLKFDPIDIDDDPVVIEPRMAGLHGPSLTLLGRDVRLAVTMQQSSPQELWHKGQWNKSRVDVPCERRNITFSKSIKRGAYANFVLDNTLGFTTYEPAVIYRTRTLAEGVLVRPHGIMLGGTISFPLSTNSESLLMMPDSRPPVRRDLARFANGVAIDRAYASWRNTPVTDLHIAVSGGMLEEMYAGIGGEIIYRPFPSPFWVGADAWQVWRRDPRKAMNFGIEDESQFTGHVRAGYDIPDTRASVYAAVGRYLAEDTGATIGYKHAFEGGAVINATLTWTGREEQEGFFRDTQIDPVLQIVWPLGKSPKREVRTTFRQVGRDGGQMLDRPMPLERMTEAFSAREITRGWPELLTKKEAASDGGL